MSLPALGSENEEENGWNADFEDSFAHPLERTLFEIEDDFGIDAAIQRVTICNIIYGNFSLFNNSRAFRNVELVKNCHFLTVNLKRKKTTSLKDFERVKIAQRN